MVPTAGNPSAAEAYPHGMSPEPAGEREKVRQRLFGTNVRPAQRGIPKGAVPTAGNPSAAEAYPHGMSPEPAGEQENVRQRRTQAGAKNGRLPKN